MAMRINPPCLTSKSYERYKLELLAWREVTDISRFKQGIVIALSLPEDDKNHIKEKVFTQINLDDLKKEDGLDKLIKFLDTHLKKDELTDSIEKFEEFEDFQRIEGQSVSEYIALFEFKYRKIEKYNMKLPSEILAFKLIRRANISRVEKMLVLTGMNFDDKDSLFEDAKRSLKKFVGDIRGRSVSRESGVKFQAASSEKNDEVLITTRCETFRRERTPNLGTFGLDQGFVNHSGVAKIRRKKNPIGANGRPLTCKACGSYRHFVAYCPDSWENIARENREGINSKSDIFSDNESEVLFTRHNQEDSVFFSGNSCGYAVLDSACSSTVCGEKWLSSYFETLDESDKDKVKQSFSQNNFKFGGGRQLKSQGVYFIPAIIAGKEVTIQTDVIAADIPLLLSRKSMKTAGVKIDLTNDTANIFGKSVMLNTTSSGHYCVPIHKTTFTRMTDREYFLLKNEPKVKDPRDEVVESYLHNDQLTGDYKKLIKNEQLYKRGHIQEEHEVYGENSFSGLSFSECSFKPDNFRLFNKEVETPRKKRRGSVRYRNDRDKGRCKKILDFRA